MKHFDVDWRAVLDALPAWEALPEATRTPLLQYGKPSTPFTASPIAHLRGELEAAGVLEPAPPTGVRVQVTDAFRPVVLVYRGLARSPLGAQPDRPALQTYLAEQFTAEEGSGLAPDVARRLGRTAVAESVASVDWVLRFLECADVEAARAWEVERSAFRVAPYFRDETVWMATRALVEPLASVAEGVPLREVDARLARFPPAARAEALKAALRYVLLLVWARPPAGEVRVGVWPEAVARRLRASVGVPAGAEPVESFGSALRMEDMTTVLIAAAAEPVRLRGDDGGVFARTLKLLAQRLLPTPDWYADAVDELPEDRVDLAAAMLRLLGLAGAQGTQAEGIRLVPTAAGTKWLEGTARERLRALLEPLRSSRERNPPAWYGTAPAWSWFPRRVQYDLEKKVDLRGALERAFLSLPSEGMAPVADFLAFQADRDNPFLDPRGRPRVDVWGFRSQGREVWEREWAGHLSIFLRDRLAPLGAVRLGLDDDGRLLAGLTPAGRYLLGAADDFEYGAAEAAQVVVQPNFEVVFLAPSPAAEATLARLAERTGAGGVGTLFRVTRRSVLAAAEAGLTAEAVLGTLRELSTVPVPENVAQQVEDWVAATRRVALRPAVLVECPDAETAMRVLSAARGLARPLTDTVVEVTASTRKERDVVVRKLREAGVFVGG